MDENTFFITKIIRSEKNAIAEVEPMLFDFKDAVNFPEDRFYNVLIAITEAVNNAIRHGNKCNPDKCVHFTIKADRTKVDFIIKDEGEGFDPDLVADPRRPENLLKESGRGIFIIRSISDKFVIESSENGTVMTITFAIN